jgi:hypothetical protein
MEPATAVWAGVRPKEMQAPIRDLRSESQRGLSWVVAEVDW